MAPKLEKKRITPFYGKREEFLEYLLHSEECRNDPNLVSAIQYAAREKETIELSELITLFEKINK
jgi:hypothetical protein